MHLRFPSHFYRNDPCIRKADRQGCGFPESLGVIIETPGFLTQYTGAKNLEILADMRGQITKADIRLILRKVGLDPDMKKTVGKYSLGMRQRLGMPRPLWKILVFLFWTSLSTGWTNTA